MRFIAPATGRLAPRFARATVCTAAILLAASVALAARTQTFTAATQKDFSEGSFDNTIVDSYGQLSLGRSLDHVKLPDHAEMVSGFVQTASGFYVAASPDGKIFAIDGDSTKEVFSAPEGFHDITTFKADAKGNLLIAMTGDTARLVSVAAGAAGKEKEAEPTTLFEEKDVSYIWDVVVAPDGSLYLATGPHGKLYHLVDGKKAEVVLETGGKNVTSLCFDKDGNLIVGTDSHGAGGLVIRIDSKSNKSFVLFDAGKMDVNALASDAEGNLYVATAKAQADETDAGAEDGDAGPDTKSKPDAPETQPSDMPTEPAPKDNAGASIAPLHDGSAPVTAGMCADPSDSKSIPPGVPPELKALLKKAAAQKADKMKGGGDHGMGPPSKGHHGPTPAAMRMMSHGGIGASDDEETAGPPAGVYRIAADGAVTALIQNGNDAYTLLIVDDNLLVGMGGDLGDSTPGGGTGSGKIFQYHLPDQSTTLLSRVKEQQITTLALDDKKQIWFGTANGAAAYRLGAGVAANGTYTSKVFDAGHSAAWGHAAVDLNVPEGTRVSISTRSGNTSDAEKNGKFWSDWSPATPLTTDNPLLAPRTPVAAPTGRYLQYRLTLTSDGDTKVPTVNAVNIAYQVHNLKPVIKSLNVSMTSDSGDSDSPDSPPDRSVDAPAPETVAHLTWDASDPAGDTLVYRLYYAQIVPGETPVWTPLARGIRESNFDWDTRALSDGKYQVKVVATDKLDNPGTDAFEVARSSQPFIIDHTPPVIGELAATTKGNIVTIKGSANDAMSIIVDVRYQVDGAGATGPGPHSGPGGQSTAGTSGGDSDSGDWQPAQPSATLFDSPQDAFTIVTHPLSAGPHRITVRAIDASGNASYKTVTIRIGS